MKKYFKPRSLIVSNHSPRLGNRRFRRKYAGLTPWHRIHKWSRYFNRYSK